MANPTDKRKQLLDVRHELEPLWNKRHLLGGRENATTQDMLLRIDRLLNPDDPEQLVDEVRAHVQTFGKYVGSMRADREAECEAEQKAAEERRAVPIAAMHAKQAAEAARKKNYQADAVARRAVDEVI